MSDTFSTRQEIRSKISSMTLMSVAGWQRKPLSDRYLLIWGTILEVMLKSVEF